MLRVTTLASCLLAVSLNVLAAPRNLVAEESQIEFIVKEMGVPVSGKFQRFEAAIDIDAAKPEKSSASLRIQVGSLTTGSDEAAVRIDIGHVRRRPGPRSRAGADRACRSRQE